MTFLVASAAISGLPPFNGFVSEFLIYVAGFSGIRAGATETVILAIVIAGGLALIGGLAAACFAKAFGIVFLGEPRSSHAAGAHEVGAAMRWPMAVLAAICLGIGLLAPLALRMVLPAVRVMAGTDYRIRSASLTSGAIRGLSGVTWRRPALLVLAAALFLIRRRLPRGREETATGTWDCGYARPTARMQYTASSFAQPLTDLFQIFLRTRRARQRRPRVLPQGGDVRNRDAGRGTRAAVRSRCSARSTAAWPPFAECSTDGCTSTSSTSRSS